MALRRAAILIVDDDPLFCGFLSELLENAGFEVLQAGDASAALALAEERPPDAAILDVGLPGVSGYSLCRELRSTHDPELPIIFVSGSRVDAIDRTAGMLIGGDDYLVKPVDPEELLARLRRLLERSRSWVKAPSVDLTDREIQVLQLIAEGCPPTQVGRQLVIAPKTVSSHIQRILAKLDVHTRAQAVAVAYELGLIRVRPREPEVAAHIAIDLVEV
jgi:two-component system, NarL family, nitrate/nitrite response regulator NarL